jgi:perosamine synthetase
MSADRRFIPLHRPDLGEAECEAAARAIRSGWVAQGPEVEAFEDEFAAFVGAPHAVAVSSGTAALELALRILGIGAGDDVITVSHSFIAAANMIRAVGARPVFVDVQPETLNIDPARIEPAITATTRALLVVHQVGLPCDLGNILDIARRRKLVVIEDAACAAGSEIAIDCSWQRIGRPHGDIACFSFHARKPITTGEGGMITCRDVATAEMLRLMRNHGMTAPAAERHRMASVTFEDYARPGSNFRLSDVAAAIGRVQLRRLSDIVSRRRALAARYAQRLAAVATPLAEPITEPIWARSNWQSYPVRLAERLDQRTVMQRMRDDGVATRRGIMCAHLEPAWPKADWVCAAGRGCACGGQHCDALINSERGRDRHILLPLFTALTEDEQDRVVAALQRACGR